MTSLMAKPNIFIIDDDEAVRDSLDAYLSLKGMNVTAFSSAQHVLNHEGHAPELLIMDVNMPDIDGFMLLEMLRHRGNGAPAVFISGLGDGEMRQRAARMGVAAFFDKPVDPTRLFASLTNLLTKSRNLGIE